MQASSLSITASSNWDPQRVVRCQTAPYLRDGGTGEDGADVLRGQVGAGRHAQGGEQEDDQGPPAGPVDHSTVMVTRHWGKKSKEASDPGWV